MAITIPPAARKDYGLAKAYLCRDSVERRIFARIEHSQRVYRLRIDRHSDDRFDPNTDAVYWDPYSALRTARGGTQSPALGLAHELDHAAESPSREERLSNATCARYDNVEERRVIRGSERHAAVTLGEAVRFDHRGSVYRVATPVSR
ncbi:MAG TPA: hypothetical protein VGZ02_01665 [Candidatus Baltobacteraceae bacterium]|jgi:hypothetical protein|nr:hypothetical protein [Candidatus Baltobacteraceae bacterium]